MVKNSLASDILTERGVNITKKFKEMVGPTEHDLFQFQNFMRHIFYNPVYRSHNKYGVNKKSRSYWCGARSYFDKCLVEDYDRPDDDLYKTLHMFNNCEKMMEFFKYWMEYTNKLHIRHIRNEYLANTSAMSYVTIGETYIELEAINASTHKIHKVMSTRVNNGDK